MEHYLHLFFFFLSVRHRLSIERKDSLRIECIIASMVQPFLQLLKAVHLPTFTPLLRPLALHRRVEKTSRLERTPMASMHHRSSKEERSSSRSSLSNIVLLLDVANMGGDVSGVCEALHRQQQRNEHHACCLSVCACVEGGTESAYDISLRVFLSKTFATSEDTGAANVCSFVAASPSTSVMLRRLALLPRTTSAPVSNSSTVMSLSSASVNTQQRRGRTGEAGAMFASSWREVFLDPNKDAADLQIAAYVTLAFHGHEQCHLQNPECEERGTSSLSCLRPSMPPTPQTSRCRCIVVTNDLHFWRGLSPLFPSTFLVRVPTNLDGLHSAIRAFCN